MTADFRSRVDPELLAGLDSANQVLPPVTADDLPAFRRRLVERLPAFDVSSSLVERQVHLGAGVALWTYTPRETGPLPAIYWMHGGGMVAGTLLGDAPYCTALAEATGCVVVAVDYRLAPENPHPIPVEDAYAGLEWTVVHADALGIDVNRVAVGGSSAGGGIAAAVALMARDRGGPALVFQYLMYPMLDDRQDTGSSSEFTGIPMWSRERNEFGWRCLLGTAAGSAGVSEYAAPARAADLQNLPPALIQVGGLDLFRDEDIAYASRLMQADVPTELHVYPGAYHGFESAAPEAQVSRRALADRNAALRHALYYAPLVSPNSRLHQPIT